MKEQPEKTYRERLIERMDYEAVPIASQYAMHELECLILSLRKIAARRRAVRKRKSVAYLVKPGRPEQIGIGRGMKTGVTE